MKKSKYLQILETPIKNGKRLFYVFFSVRGRLAGHYAKIWASRYSVARDTAYELWGVAEVATIESNIENAREKINLFNYKEIKT